MNIQEDYVSFETAKLLKEKGFKGDCIMSYIDNELMNVYDDDYPSMYELENTEDNVVDAPTLQMAMKWLREVHHVACFICPSIEQGFHTNKWNSYIDKLSDNFPKDSLWFVETSDSYEQACEAAIKYCLENLI